MNLEVLLPVCKSLMWGIVKNGSRKESFETPWEIGKSVELNLLSEIYCFVSLNYESNQP